MSARGPVASVFVLAAVLSAASAHAAATITIVNNDGAGEGFNDPAPRAPVGNNPGTTLGQQRLNAFNFVAGLWGQWITSSVTIQIRAQFNPQTCGAGGAVLGSAGAITVSRNNAAFPFADTWFHAALANKLAGTDLVPSPPASDPDINATFNSALDTACLPGTSGWYYGLTGVAPAGTIDLVPVLMHEMAHGLGFSTFVNTATGVNLGTPPSTDIYSRFTQDLTSNLFWNQMTDVQRQASAINVRGLVWNGPSVTSNIAYLALGSPEMTINTPPSLAGPQFMGAALFGPPPGAGGLTGNVVLGDDGAGAINDACEPLINGAAIAGNLCLVDRGTCTFPIKVKNCQNAGAIGAVVADNVAGSPPPGMSGVDPTITIPSGRITLALGTSIKAQLPAPGVNLTLISDTTQRAGADQGNTRVFLNATNPLQPGSSVSHFDPITFPNTLMEPAINLDLQYRPDLTENQFEDIGWGPVTPVQLQQFKVE